MNMISEAVSRLQKALTKNGIQDIRKRGDRTMKKVSLPKLPKSIVVDIKKGTSGVLIAELPKLDIFTEATDLNDLFLQVNDLVCTYYDISKKYQDKICFVPNTEAREELLRVAQQRGNSKFSQLRMHTFYSEDLCRSILSA